MTQALISHEQLIKTAGQTRFDQGLMLFNQSSTNSHQTLTVSDFHYKNKLARANIGQFVVNIHYHSETIEGSCNCPDSDGFDFCQHCVFLVLHANKNAQQINALSKGPDKSKILAYLLTQDKQTLAKQCLELIEKDADQFKRFVLKAFLNNETIDYSLLKTQITDLTRKPDNLFSQRQVKLFFSKIDLFLGELSLSNYLNAPEKMIKLIEYAFQRINHLLNSIDDSNIQRQSCIEKLQLMYEQLMTEISGRPDTKAKHLYNFWLNDTHALLGQDPELYLTQENCRTKFKDLAKTSWKNIQDPDKKPATKTNLKALTEEQEDKIARYLLETLIQAGEHDKTQPFRDFLTRH